MTAITRNGASAGADPSPFLEIALTVVAGCAAALLNGWLASLVAVFTAVAFVVAWAAPQFLTPLLVSALVILPPFVGWLTPIGQFFDLPRGVFYGSAFGILLWMSRDRRRLRQTFLPMGLDARLAVLLLCVGWLSLPLVAVAHGASNVAKAVNAVVYEALPFWIGLRFGRVQPGRRLLQVTFAILLLYTIPFWLHELDTGRSYFHSYVPPLRGMMNASALLLRGAHTRVQATFTHPLAFGQFLLLATPIAGSLVFAARLRLLGLASIAVGVLSILATGSRSPWAALIGGAVALGAVRKPRVFLVAIVAAALIVGLSPPSSPLSLVHFKNSVHEAAGETLSGFSTQNEPLFSSAARIFLTIASLRAIAARPVVGYGLNALESGAAIPTVDNYYLRLTMEVGIPVSLCILGGLVIGWISLARRAQNAERMILTYAVGAYLVEFLFVGLRDSLPAVLLIMGYLWSHDGTPTQDNRSRQTPADKLLNTTNQEGTN